LEQFGLRNNCFNVSSENKESPSGRIMFLITQEIVKNN